jgi:hypothetical protein
MAGMGTYEWYRNCMWALPPKDLRSKIQYFQSFATLKSKAATAVMMEI